MEKHPDFEFEVTERRKVKRYNLRNALSSTLDAFNLERGLLHTLLSLIKSPGISTRHYLADGRLRYSSPFKLLLISTTLVLLIFQSSNLNPWPSLKGPENAENVTDLTEAQFEKGFAVGKSLNPDSKAEAQLVSEKFERISKIYNDYFNLVIWLYIPIVSFFSWFFKRKRDLNYAEHIIFNTYYTSVINVFSLILFLSPFVNTMLLFSLYMILSLGYFIYYYHSLFDLTWLRSIGEGIGISLLSVLIYGIFIALISLSLSPFV